MFIPDFRYHRPSTLDDAVRLIADNPDGAILAGGTDLLVDMKQGKRFHQDLISLTRIDELGSIGVDGATLVIGAAVTQNQLAESPVIREHCHVKVPGERPTPSDPVRQVVGRGLDASTTADAGRLHRVNRAFSTYGMIGFRLNRTPFWRPTPGGGLL